MSADAEASKRAMLLMWTTIHDESQFLQSLVLNDNFDITKARESLARLAWAIEAQVAV